MGTDRPDAGFLNRLKLASKLISNKGRLDKLMLFFYAAQRVQGAQDQAHFNGFLQFWDENGWAGMLDLYNRFRGDRPASWRYLT